MNKFASCAIASAAIAAAIGLTGLGDMTEAHAQPGPNWCPGDFWDPSWGTNWNWNACHGNVVVPPNTNNGPTIIQRPPPPPHGGPGGPGGATPATPVVRVDLAARGRADPAGRVTVVDPGDMNRVVAATAGTVAVMAPADRAVPVGQVGMIPVVRVGMTLEDPVGPVGMIQGDPEGRLRAQNPAVRVDPERLVVPNPVARVEPGNREATDLSLGRVLLGRMPMRRVRMSMGRHPTAAGPVRTPVLLHLAAADRRTPVDRRRDRTTRAAVDSSGGGDS